MIEFITIWFLFICSLALSVVGVLLLFRLKVVATFKDVRSLHYAQLLFYTYGFYVLWGRLLVQFIMPEVKIGLNFRAVISMNQILGLPFLITAFIVMINWMYRESGMAGRKLVLVLGTLLLMALTVAHFIFYRYEILEDAVGLNQVVVALFSLWLSVTVLFGKFIKPNNRLMLVLSFIVLFAGNLAGTFFWQDIVLVAAVLNFIFFLVLSLIPVSLYYGLASDPGSRKVLTGGHENIYNKYGITQREKEVILHLINGSTNQQIADALFITLQTVKDHNSRIYMKAGVKNRMQLMKLFHDIKV